MTTFKQKVDYIKGLKGGTNLIDKIIKWSRNSCSYYQFRLQFIPVHDCEYFHCCKCGQTFTYHVGVDPCGHKFCPECLLASLTVQESNEQIYCDVCRHEIRQISPDSQIIRLQLHAMVHCINYREKHVRFVYYNQSEVTPQNNPLGIAPEVFKMQRLFNNSDDPPYAVNILRERTIKKNKQISEDIQAQIDGTTRKIVFYKHSEIVKDVIIAPCPYVCQYDVLNQHIRNCPHCVKQCRYCQVKYPQEVMERHLLNCQQQPVACPICYQDGIPMGKYNEHAVECLGQIKAIMETIEDKASYGVQQDMDLQIKVDALSMAINNLTVQIFQMDNTLQNELAADYQQWSGPQKGKPKSRIFLAATNFFNNKFLLYAITESVAVAMIYQLMSHFAFSGQKIVGGIIFALQTIVFILFMVYARYLSKYQLFRHQTARFFVMSYFSMLIWFAGYFMTIEMLIPGSIIVKGYDRRYDSHPGEIFMYMVYCSSVMGGRVGFGDVVPRGLLGKAAFLAHIYVISYIQIIWFRGLSFMIKVSSINHFQRRANAKRRSLNLSNLV